MFTPQSLTTAHARVKSGADFPAYIREIKQLGVTHYETYVADGHIDYHGAGDYTVTIPPKYDVMAVADAPDAKRFGEELAAHQQGKTDFPTFIKSCAEFGIARWEIDLGRMTCTYFDKAGREVLQERIPE